MKLMEGKDCRRLLNVRVMWTCNDVGDRQGDTNDSDRGSPFSSSSFLRLFGAFILLCTLTHCFPISLIYILFFSSYIQLYIMIILTSINTIMKMTREKFVNMRSLVELCFLYIKTIGHALPDTSIFRL